MFGSIVYSTLLASSFIGFATAAPTTPSKATCDISGAFVHLGEFPSMLPHPQYNPKYVFLGVGTQNYTCNGTSYVLDGAVAGLVDVSCNWETSYKTLATQSLSIWNQSNDDPITFVRDGVLAQHSTELGFRSPSYFGEHFFVGKLPRWDFSVPKGLFEGQENAFVNGAQPAAATIAAPGSTGTGNIAWLYLTRQDGELASEIYRTDTRGGVAPPSCSGSDSIQVKYTSIYWLTERSGRN
ncbi:hypothetical protein D9758_010991 [Tetrapyrgos nigripes]|uniref:Malate dehydrogenase n=1 Tax=Tetrapyrgos nigripes TaxID=182062 RepID=A0A8H5LPD6_9AGAR|nr:hypothetical protein D9758_010991 [Tetrapyrgos nigripes]